MRKFFLFSLLMLFVAPLTLFAQEEVTWEKLAQISYEREDGRYVLKVADDVMTLNGKEITLTGFIMPLDQAKTQKNFILSSMSLAGCAFCAPGGPESMIEVQASEGVEFTYEAIKVTGRLEVLKDDPNGLVYRIVSAQAAS